MAAKRKKQRVVARPDYAKDHAKRLAIVCPQCRDTVFSRVNHDMRYCECGMVAIDGGASYAKVTFDPDQMPEYLPEFDTGHTEQELYTDWNTGADKFGKIEARP